LYVLHLNIIAIALNTFRQNTVITHLSGPHKTIIKKHKSICTVWTNSVRNTRQDYFLTRSTIKITP